MNSARVSPKKPLTSDAKDIVLGIEKVAKKLARMLQKETAGMPDDLAARFAAAALGSAAQNLDEKVLHETALPLDVNGTTGQLIRVCDAWARDWKAKQDRDRKNASDALFPPSSLKPSQPRREGAERPLPPV